MESTSFTARRYDLMKNFTGMIWKRLGYVVDAIRFGTGELFALYKIPICFVRVHVQLAMTGRFFVQAILSRRWAGAGKVSGVG